MWFNSKQREEPYQGLTSLDRYRDIPFPSGTRRQVVHGCRQLVSWDVGLSPATSATLIDSYFIYRDCQRKLEEGGDDVKSSCPLYPGPQTCYNGWYKVLPNRKVELITKNQSQLGLRAEIRPHEVGITSNHESDMSWWIRSLVLYTPPVKLWESLIPKNILLTVMIRMPRVGTMIGVKS